MKRFFSALVMMLMMVLAVFAGNKVKTVFTLDHQMSQMCEKKIKENLRYEKGVTGIDVSLKANTITVTYDNAKTNPEQILAGFKKIGFNAEVVSPDAKAAAKAPAGCCGGKAAGGCCGAKAEGGCCGAKAAEGCCKDKKVAKPEGCCKDKK